MQALQVELINFMWEASCYSGEGGRYYYPAGGVFFTEVTSQSYMFTMLGLRLVFSTVIAWEIH